MADQGVHEERDGRSSSPPGRESRDDWKGRGREKNGRATELEQRKKSRSRSRSPIRRRRRSFSPNRQTRYARDGTNTTSKEPHLERARLFVGNIEPQVHRRDLVKLFSQYGDVLGASVHKGYAFVQMDRERTANKAINAEDNGMFMGSKINVEFSQAALKAGAKFERLPPAASPPRMPPPPSLPPTRGSILSIDPYLEEQERQREERLARILQMERELALLRAREGDVLGSKPPPSHLPSQSAESPYDHDVFLRRSPGPSHSSSLGPPSYHQPSYSRESRDNGVYSGEHGGSDRSRNYYSSRSSPPSREYATRGYSGSSNTGSNSATNSYREPVSYPTQYGSSNSSSGFSSGSGRYSTRSSNPSVGYGGTASATKTKSNLPPGWPSSDNKPLINRPPFSVGGPWS